MNEASKTRAVRTSSFFKTYLSGSVIDIGCGRDPVVPQAVPFDREHGDANSILQYFPAESFDCVHSSHCLEDVDDPARCLRDWWSLVKPGGYLITVVPDEDLYEQGNWPSLFNSDHRHTFRIDGAASWSPVSVNLRECISSLPDAVILSAQKQDLGYVYVAAAWKIPWPRALTILSKGFSRVAVRLGIGRTRFARACMYLALRCGYPVDQTLGDAMAQIEVVAKKTAALARR